MGGSDCIDRDVALIQFACLQNCFFLSFVIRLGCLLRVLQFSITEIWIHLYLSQNNVLIWLSISFNSFSLVHCLVIFKKKKFSLAFIYCLSVPFSPEGNNYLSYTNDIVRNTDDKVQINLKSKEQGD